jgi:hypothetical protein
MSRRIEVTVLSNEDRYVKIKGFTKLWWAPF